MNDDSSIDVLDIIDIIDEDIYLSSSLVKITHKEKLTLRDHNFIKEKAGFNYFICDCGAALIGHTGGNGTFVKEWSLILPAHNEGDMHHLVGNYSEIKNILL